MASIFVVHCADGKACRHPLDEGMWVNFAWDRETAQNDLLRLDNPTESQGAKFLRKNDPNAFARFTGSVKATRCSPHKIVEYRAVQ